MKEKINFSNQEFQYINSGKRGYHELAAHLLNGKLSYPTVVFLDEDLNVIQAIKGFQNAENFELIMTFFAENHYKNTPWKSYIRSYNSKLAVPVGGNR
jgi:thioredoxin-related protein